MYQTKQNAYREAISYLCPALVSELMCVSSLAMETASEVRLCVGRPPVLLCGGREVEINASPVTPQLLEECIFSLTDCSVQSHEAEIAQGFLSVKGGHRAGLAGTAVFSDGERPSVIGMREYNAIVLRIAHEGNAESRKAAEFLLKKDCGGTLLAGVPGSGKTTLLRRMAEILSENGKTPVLIDERGEFSEVSGICRLSGYPKAQAILMALRALSPRFLLCDELGGEEDAKSVLWALNCGVAMIGTVHAKTLPELLRRQGAAMLLASGAFSQIAILSSSYPGRIKEVYQYDELSQTWRIDPAFFCGDALRGDAGDILPQQDRVSRAGDPFFSDAAPQTDDIENEDRAASALCL